MSFSTKTWNVGDVLTAADMNQYVRDSMLAVTRSLNTNVTAQSIASSAAETTLYTYTVPAGTLSVGAFLRVSAIGQLIFNNGADSITFRVKVGGVTIWQGALTSSPSGNWRSYALQMLLSADSSTSASFAGSWNISDSAVPTTGAGNISLAAGTYGLGFGEVSDIAYTLANATAVAVTVQHGSASANLVTQIHAAMTEYIPPA